LQEILSIAGTRYVSVYFGRAERGDHDRRQHLVVKKKKTILYQRMVFFFVKLGVT
jgi:hypothetical protein